MTTIANILLFARQRLPSSETAMLDAHMLLCRVLATGRAYLLAHPEHVLTPEQAAQYADWINRRAAGEPVAYILGEAGFFDRDFRVTPAVLIPRPETEHLVEEALLFIQQQPHISAADIGTGSGAIAVTVAANAPRVTMHATDVSSAALTLARHNAAQHGVNITFHQGHLAQPLITAGITVRLLMANLPYIASDELPKLDVSKYEPHLALDGGSDGLRLIAELLEAVPQICQPGALILLEIGADQGAAAAELAQQTLSPQFVSLIKDYAGHDRVVRIQLAP